MGHEVVHFAMVPEHPILVRCGQDPEGYGSHLWMLPGATAESLARDRRMVHSVEDVDPLELVFIRDCEVFCVEHPLLEGLTCTLDRRYQQLGFVLAELRPDDLALQRACVGGEVLPGLVSGTGWPYRWLGAEEVRGVAASLASVESETFRTAFERCGRSMAAACVYKAPPFEQLTPGAMEEWGDLLWMFLVEDRRFFEAVAARGLGVLTCTG